MTATNAQYLAKLQELLKQDSPDPELTCCVGMLWWLTLPETKAEILKQLSEPSPMWEFILKERKKHEQHTDVLPSRPDTKARPS